MTEERVVLVDDQNTELGLFPKSLVHTDATPLHRAFSCFLFNRKGELLLQKRALTKRTWPGIWANSCCGHPGPEERTEDAVYRRIDYELGIRRQSISGLTEVLPEFRYYVKREGIVENELCPVFVAVTDDEPNPNPEEVAAVQWIPWEKFTTLPRAVLSALLLHSVPKDEATYAAYVASFKSPSRYAAAHTLYTGEPISEWCLWESALLVQNESFMTAVRLRGF